MTSSCPDSAARIVRIARIARVPAALVVLLASSSARADDPPPDELRADDLASRHEIDRTSLYGDDARIPLPMTVIATTSFSYTSIGSDPTQVSSPYPTEGANCYTPSGAARPCYAAFAGNTAQPGAQMILSGELGLLPRVSVVGSVMTGIGGAGGVPSPDLGGSVGVRYQALPSSWTHTHLVLSGGYIREAYNPPTYNDDRAPPVWLPGSTTGVNAGYIQAAFSSDVGRVRLGGTFHGQHTFADGRDPLDVMIIASASYRVVGDFRLGAEYVGQDLEEAFSAAAEGGARHFVGPTASVQVWHKRVTIVGGPSVGLSALSPDFVARVGASIGF